MITLNQTRCCGVGEIDNLSKVTTPEEALKALYPALKRGLTPLGRPGFGCHKCPLITFTGVIGRAEADHASGRSDDYGQALANYINDHGLGKVVKSAEVKNWTSNSIRLWVWAPDYQALDKWMKDQC